MGILETDKPVQASPATRRKSGLDFGSLKPLNAATGTKNFGGYRDGSKDSPKTKNKHEDAMDSDADDEDDAKIEQADEDKEVLDKGLLSPEDAAKQGELAEGVRKIKVSHPSELQSEVTRGANTRQLKRQHSAEPLSQAQASGSTSASPHSSTPVPAEASSSGTTTAAGGSGGDAMTTDESVASPFKKQRASLPGFDSDVRKSLGQALVGGKERGNSEGMIPGSALESRMEEDEEL
jgi:hypothetical protein